MSCFSHQGFLGGGDGGVGEVMVFCRRLWVMQRRRGGEGQGKHTPNNGGGASKKYKGKNLKSP